MTQKEFYQTVAWRRARDAYIKQRISIDGGVCEVCGDELGYIVHHKIWLDDDNCNDIDVSLNPNNFRYECMTCHNKEIDPRRRVPGRCKYDADGNIIPKQLV